MQFYLLLATFSSIITLIIYFFLSWLSEKKSVPIPDFVITILRFILFTSAALMLLIALALV